MGRNTGSPRAAAGRGDRVRRHLAVERADGHVGIERGIAREVGDLVECELADRDLVGVDAGLGQDHAQQRDAGLGAADHADLVAGEIADALDPRRAPRAPLAPVGAHSTTTFLRRIATDLGVGRQIEIAAHHREVDLVGGEQRDAFGGALCRDRLQPHRAFPRAQTPARNAWMSLTRRRGRVGRDRDRERDRTQCSRTAVLRRRRTRRCRSQGPGATSFRRFSLAGRCALPGFRSCSDIWSVILARKTRRLP